MEPPSGRRLAPRGREGCRFLDARFVYGTRLRCPCTQRASARPAPLDLPGSPPRSRRSRSSGRPGLALGARPRGPSPALGGWGGGPRCARAPGGRGEGLREEPGGAAARSLSLLRAGLPLPLGAIRGGAERKESETGRPQAAARSPRRRLLVKVGGDRV